MQHDQQCGNEQDAPAAIEIPVADAESSERVPAAIDVPLTAALVQRMIDASFVRFEIRHGHLGADDGARQLADLEGA